MHDRILVPTDGSETAQSVMDHALDLAVTYETDIHLLHVINTRQYDTSIESQVAPLRRKGRTYLDQLEERAEDTDIDVSTAIEVGRPAQEILTYADANDVTD